MYLTVLSVHSQRAPISEFEEEGRDFKYVGNMYYIRVGNKTFKVSNHSLRVDSNNTLRVDSYSDHTLENNNNNTPKI